MKAKDYYFTYQAIGQVRGNIWMPCTECTMEFNEAFSRDQSIPFTYPFDNLDDIKNHLTNNGNFRSCVIDEGMLIVTLHYMNRTITRYLDLAEESR